MDRVDGSDRVDSIDRRYRWYIWYRRYRWYRQIDNEDVIDMSYKVFSGGVCAMVASEFLY